MREELGNLVHPVLAYGLKLKDRLDRGKAPLLDIEQAALRALLLTDLEARRWVDFGGESDRESVGYKPELSEDEESPVIEQFLGVRYALVCWLDELFILNSSWESAWNERKLEVALYGTNDRAWRFWEQAQRAETRPSTDALEVFYLCVMLGFRGELRDDPERLRAWTKAAQARLTRVGEDWPHPPELDPPTNVPPLHGRDRFRRMVYVGSVVLLVLIPIVAFIVVQQFGE